ncbi:MAG TPA: DinB family protein [Chitinophagaceae bacterium]|nr:DinB family protein [Chitinophagaceae bacterium]
MPTSIINESITGKAVFIKMVLSAWDSYNARVNKLIDALSEEQLSAETAPGRNSGVYLLGHLTAVSDALFPILGFGERLYPQLDKIFLENPDKSGLQMPPINELKEYWKKVNIKLTDHILQVPEDEWFTRHNNISEADFANEPHRNKLNIIINRTNHTSYHLGQLVYLAKKD